MRVFLKEIVRVTKVSTSNQIDAKIEPQISLIAVNFIDKFSYMISAFKGRLPNVFSQCS